MKGVLMFTLGAFLAMQSPDATRPFPNHEQPPKGWFCHPALDAKDLKTSAHACACRGMTMTDPQPTEEQCQKQPNSDVLIEHSTCKVFCHKDHCHCARRCTST